MDEMLTTMKSWMSMNDTKFQNHEAAIRNLETPLGNLANMIADRPQGSLPSNTERNPREYAKAITLSGTELPEVVNKENELPKEPETKEKDTSSAEPPVATKPEVVPYKPRIPFSRRLQQEKLDKQDGKFLEVFKKLHINIPSAEALAQVPKYVKFLKKLLSNKEKLEDTATIAMN